VAGVLLRGDPGAVASRPRLRASRGLRPRVDGRATGNQWQGRGVCHAAPRWQRHPDGAFSAAVRVLRRPGRDVRCPRHLRAQAVGDAAVRGPAAERRARGHRQPQPGDRLPLCRGARLARGVLLTWSGDARLLGGRPYIGAVADAEPPPSRRGGGFRRPGGRTLGSRYG